jgi:hypothetical protein
MNLPVIIRQGTTPDNPAEGYSDLAQVLDEQENVIYSCPCRTHPNAFRPSDHARWQDCYADLAPGKLHFECIQHEEYGKCFLLNGGGEVSTLYPDSNNGGRYFAKGCFVHPGGLKSANPNWPGSKGCITIPQANIETYMSYFDLGATGALLLSNEITNRQSATHEVIA